MPTTGLSSDPGRKAHGGAVAASNRTREIRPSGIIGRLWEPSAMEDLGFRSVTERADVGHSPPNVLRTQFLSRSAICSRACTTLCFEDLYAL